MADPNAIDAFYQNISSAIEGVPAGSSGLHCEYGGIGRAAVAIR